jgi:hypothetical protein
MSRTHDHDNYWLLSALVGVHSRGWRHG